VRHPCRMRRRCRRHDRHGLLVRHPDEVRQSRHRQLQVHRHRSPDAVRRSLDEVRQHQPDEDRPDEVRRLLGVGHLGDLHHPDLVGPCPG